MWGSQLPSAWDSPPACSPKVTSMAEKVLVTGASGFIAQHVILQLLEA
jgi:hypothetical protein